MDGGVDIFETISEFPQNTGLACPRILQSRSLCLYTLFWVKMAYSILLIIFKCSASDVLNLTPGGKPGGTKFSTNIRIPARVSPGKPRGRLQPPAGFSAQQAAATARAHGSKFYSAEVLQRTTRTSAYVGGVG